MADLFPPTIDEQLIEVEREIASRKHVYGSRVAARKMTRQQADKKIALMEAVATTLAGLKAGR